MTDLFRLAVAAVFGGVAIHVVVGLAALVAADAFDRAGIESADRWSR